MNAFVNQKLSWRRPFCLGMLAGSIFHAVSASGQVIGWGNDALGQAAPPPSVINVRALAAGDTHSLAIQTDGTVVGWGANTYGQTTTPAGLVATAISAGTQHSLALKEDGTVVAWGRNVYGETTVPAGLSGVIAVEAGHFHSLALKSDGTVVAWGFDSYGQSSPPAGLSNVKAISTAAYGSYCLALKADGTVVGWGANNFGKASPPAGLSGVQAISAGVNFSLALKTDGTVVGWGDDTHGQVSTAATLTDVVAIEAAQLHGLALKRNATVVAWGWDYHGQVTLPSVLEDRGVSKIAAGRFYNLADTFLCGGGPVASINWSYTDLGFILGGQNGALRQYSDSTSVAASPWVPANAGLTLRLNFENDAECPAAYHNPYRQIATALGTVQPFFCGVTRMNINWSGLGEKELPQFEKMVLYVKDTVTGIEVEAGQAHAPGGQQGCAAPGPVISVPDPPQYFDLIAGRTYELRILADTVDEFYHIGAYYQFDLSFDIISP
jgi:hypothetical protein